jgi:hypothetical protein
MADPGTPNFARRALPLALLLGAGLLASCSSDNSTPVTPTSPNTGTAPSPMFTVVGEPRIAVRFTGLMNETSDTAAVSGAFTATLTDSTGRRTFLNDLRLNGVPMHQEVDAFGLPSRYTLDAAELPGLRLADTLYFEAVDGGEITTPFTYRIYPSHLALPDDSTRVSPDSDITVSWTGAVERVLITLTDLTGKRLRINLQTENYTGLTQLVIPGRDFAGLYPGDIQVGTDVLDAELVLGAGLRQQAVQIETRQNRLWRLAPSGAVVAPSPLALR